MTTNTFKLHAIYPLHIERLLRRNEILQGTGNMIFRLYCLINIKSKTSQDDLQLFYLYTKKRKF